MPSLFAVSFTFFSGVSAFDQGSDFLNPVLNRKVASFRWVGVGAHRKGYQGSRLDSIAVEKLFELPAIFLYHLDNF